MSENQVNVEGYQGQERRAPQGWHVDKSVSISHILATVGIAVSCLWFIAEQDKRIAVNTKDIEHNTASIEQQENRINRSLDAIHNKLDKLTDLIIRSRD